MDGESPHQLEARIRRETLVDARLDEHDRIHVQRAGEVTAIATRVGGLERKVEQIQMSMATEDRVEEAVKEAAEDARGQGVTRKQLTIGYASLAVVVLAALLTPILTAVLR